MATTDLERLVVSLEANIKKYEREMERARGVADKALREVERSASATTSRIDNIMGRVGASIRGGLAAALAGISVKELAGFVDANTRVVNSLKVAGLEGDALTTTYQALFAIAQKQAAPFESLASLFGTVSLSQKELGVSTQELTRFTEGVAVALRVSGKSSQEASGALLQLGQLLGAGKVQAEEFNSVQEGALPILQAVSRGLVEAGGSVSKLKELVKEGKVSSEAFFRAFEAGTPYLEELAGRTAPTFSQGVVRISNAVTQMAGEADKLAGASEKVSQAIDTIVKSVGTVPEVFKTTIQEVEALVKVYNSLSAAIRTAFLSRGIYKQDPLPSEPNDPPPLAIRVKPRPGAGTPGTGGEAGIKPVSLKSFKVPGEKEKGGGGGGGGADKVNEYEREIKAIEKRTRAFDSERETVGKTALEVAKAEGAFKLLEAAEKAGVPVTDALKQNVDRLALAYAKAKVALDEAEEKQRSFEDGSRQAGAMLSDGFKDALLNGEKLVNVVDKLIKSIASRGIDSLFDAFFSKEGIGTNLFKSVLSGGFADGGYTGPGRKNAPRGVVHAGEVVWSQADIRRAGGVGTVEAMRRGAPGYAGGGVVGMPSLAPMSPGRIVPMGRRARTAAPVNVTTNINAPNSDAAGLARLERIVREQEASLPKRLWELQRRNS